MSINSNIEELAQVYTDELLLAEDLQKLLVAEEAALRSRDSEFIQNCTEKKNILLERFESFEVKRKEIQDSVSDTKNQVISDKHSKLQKMLENIQHQNTVNAGIIKVSQEFTQQILNIMRGVTQHQTTYDQSGNTSNNNSNQYLAKV